MASCVDSNTALRYRTVVDPADHTPPTSEPRLDPRVALSRDRVLATTFDLLMENGVSGLTIDEVSRRSGVAKTTIYRHWRDRSSLILDACSRIADSEEPPDTGSLESDLTSIASAIAELLGSARWASILPSIVDVAERDPDFADIHSAIQRGHAAPIRTALERAATRGEIPPVRDPDAVAALLLGPLFYRRWFARQPTDKPFVDAVVGATLAAVR